MSHDLPAWGHSHTKRSAADPRRRAALEGMGRGMLLVAWLVVVTACSSGGPSASSPSAPVLSGPSGEPTAAAPADLLEGSFDVGGYKLYLRCSGTSSPTVVYLHGSVPDPAFSGSSSALAIQELIDDHHRMCVYDRANVGLSDAVEGPLTGTTSVRDLHRLLDAGGIQPPYVLLPASFGGLIADIYAATYPDEVVGMVQLDANLPDMLEAMRRFIPKEDRLRPGDWVGTNEEIDELAVFDEARALERELPAIPLTFLAATELSPDPKEVAGIRTLQRAFVDRFSPGRLIILDVPHYMEPEIPQRIAREIEGVIAAAVDA